MNHQFNKTIINKNKNEVILLANIILDEFLRKIIILNIISLLKLKKVIVIKNIINYNN